jgi:hypothetical protein
MAHVTADTNVASLAKRRKDARVWATWAATLAVSRPAANRAAKVLRIHPLLADVGKHSVEK